jgi:hypothetical protein
MDKQSAVRWVVTAGLLFFTFCAGYKAGEWTGVEEGKAQQMRVADDIAQGYTAHLFPQAQEAAK